MIPPEDKRMARRAMTTPSPDATGKVPLIIGEVLFDHFPDGHRVIGGAPFNVAWNLHGLNVRCLLASAIGEDEPGQEVIETMHQWLMETSAIESNDAPTGAVEVEIIDGQPTYQIVYPSAFDGLTFNQQSNNEASLIYLGSLILRHDSTRFTIQSWIEDSDAPLFVDLNLRDPWVDAGSVDWLLTRARWAKVNQDELDRVVGGLEGFGWEPLTAAAARLMNRYGVETLIVSAGSAGALLLDGGKTTIAPAPAVNRLVDTVGAGDALASYLIAAIEHGLDLAKQLQNAVDFASAVCEVQGATTTNRHFYRPFASSIHRDG